MQYKNHKIRFGALALSGLLALCGAAPAMAAPNNSDRAQASDWEDADIIDWNQQGSLTIHKYDITTAEAKGIYKEGQIKATGEANSWVESALKDYGIEGVQFTYKKLGDIETHSVNHGQTSTVEVVYEIPNDLVGILGLANAPAVDMSAETVAKPCHHTGVRHYTSDQLADAMELVNRGDNVEVKNTLESYVYNYDSKKPKEGAVNMPMTDKAGYTTAEHMDLGLYLVVETEVPENVTSTVNPWLLTLPFTNAVDEMGEEGGQRWLYDMICYPKNQTGNPTLDKSVRDVDSKDETYGNTTTASTGDVLDYTLMSRLPHITSSATYLTQYTFVDTLSKGLTYNQDVKIAFYHDAASAAENKTGEADLIWDSQSGYFDVKCGSFTQEAGASELTIAVNKEGLGVINGSRENANGVYGLSDYYMVAYYTVTVNEDATLVLGDEGNPNDVTLIWSRTSDQFYDTLEDRNYVYSYGLDLTKIFADKKGDFTKVHFRLYNVTDDTYIQAEKAKDGIYYVTGRVADKKDATVFVPDKTTGELKIHGLEADKYRLTETATDDGYSLLKDAIEFEIVVTDRDIVESTLGLNGKTDMYVGEIQPANATVDGKTATMTDLHGCVLMSVTNTKNIPLPQTGGNGLYTVTILGVLTVAGGCVLMGRKKTKA